MAGELVIKLPTGLTLKALVLNENRTQRWDGSAFVAISSVADADWETGMVDMVEQVTDDSTATGIYVGDFPIGVETDGEFMALFFEDAAPILPGATARGQQTVWWDGTGNYAPSDNIYQAEAKFIRDDANSQDRYTIQWLKNGIIVAVTAITDVKITVDKDDDTRIVNNQNMSKQATSNLVVYTATLTKRLPVGEGGRAKFQATIDGATREWPLTIGRDST